MGVKTYEVQPGDSPASIAAQENMAGCPKCSRDLIAANPHKPTITMPNGYITFRELKAGEKLNLPDKWSDGTLDRLPKEYFAALPYADGVTLGVHGTLSGPPYSDEIVAAAKAADAALDADENYCASVARVGSPVNSAVHAFKVAWNKTQSPVPINTGNYELPTAEAMYLVLGEAFEPCATRAVTPPRSPTKPARLPAPAPKKEELSTGSVIGLSLLGAAAVGGGVYLATRRRRRR